MPPPSAIDLARRYCVDDLPGAIIPGSWLRTLLERIEAGPPLGPLSSAGLEQRGFAALRALTSGEMTFDAFQKQARAEQQDRLAAERQRAEHDEGKRRAREAELAANIDAFFAAQQNDPAHRRREEERQLKARYGIGYVEHDVYPRFMSLIRRIDAGQRILAEDVVWLSLEADAWTSELRKAHHKLEAEASSAEWNRTGDPWAAITASSHWRKAEEPEKALAVTEAATAAAAMPGAKRLRSALATTRGGAMRDLRRLHEALDLGHQAHRHAPNDFRPCTLLGAVCIDLGDHSTGMDWYDKAEQLGAERADLDQELRALFTRATPEERERLVRVLLSRDAHRFAWAPELAARKRV